MMSFCRATAAVTFAVAATMACARGPGAGPLVIKAEPGNSPAERAIQVVGLSGAELRALRDAGWDESSWQALFGVTVHGEDTVHVLGRYVATDAALEFHPRFPFDLGRPYSVRFDPSRLPAPRQDAVVTSTIEFPAPVRSSSTTVERIYPSADVWPENMLRFYVHFSAPMSRTSGVKFIHLVDASGEEIPDAILAAYSDLWNTDGTRLTVFFDPGRVKRGVGPNLAMGRAIVQGRRYAISVDPAWPDAAGQPLTGPFRKVFTAGPPAYDGLALSDWRLAPPKAGSRDPLVATFPAPLDRALLDRALAVRTAAGADVPGQASVAGHETGWEFTPDTPWQAGSHHLRVLTALEDPSGNKVGQPFELLPTTPRQDTTAEIATLEFLVR